MFSLKEEEEADPNAQRGHTADDLCLSATHPSVSIFPTGYIPTHSPTPPTSTLRATRAHDADLLIYSFTVSLPPLARHQDSQGYSSILSIYMSTLYINYTHVISFEVKNVNERAAGLLRERENMNSFASANPTGTFVVDERGGHRFRPAFADSSSSIMKED